MPALRLWSWNLSPFAGKVRIALAEKGVDAELVEVDPRDRPARLLELNPPHGRVPVLELDGVAMRESAVICDWLEETYPDPPFWPAGAAERAVARGLARWVDDELTRNFFLAMRKEAFGLASTDHPDIVALLRAALRANWPVAETLLARRPGPWLMGGAAPTLADLSAIPLAVRVARWLPDLAPDPETQPLTAAWLAELRERPSAAEVGRKGSSAPSDEVGRLGQP